jgi:hypothetical protein
MLVAPIASASTGVPDAGASTVRVGAVADASTRSDQPRRAQGRERRLRVAAGRTRGVAFLRFRLPRQPSAAIRQATLRLRATARTRRAVVVLRSVRTGGWTESRLTWRRQPGLGAAIDRSGSFAKGAWVSFDATRLVRRSRHGRVDMAVAVASPSGSAGFASREARSGRPRLVLRSEEPRPAPPAAPNPFTVPDPIADLGPIDTSPAPAITPTPTPTPTSTPGAGDTVVTAAGDIADDGSGDTETAKLVAAINPHVVLTTGDNAYPDGAAADYESWYAPTWGAFKDKTRPVPGNHDYQDPEAAGYFDYFNGAGNSSGPAGERGKGYYSFDLGGWHLIALNTSVSHSPSDVQSRWLHDDLAAHAGQCTLAYWHAPRWTSGAEHGNDTSVDPWWTELYAAGADVVLNGHNHQYERFAPQDPMGNADPSRGIREFVVGTGGAGLYAFGPPQPNSEVRDASANGVLKLTLHQDSYDWSFEPVAGQTFTDSGTAACHHADAAPTPRYPLRGVFFRQSDGNFDVEVAHGFNLIDSNPGEVSELPAGVKALTWVGDYDKTNCTWQSSDAQLTTWVTAHKDDPQVGVWFIGDEPWIGGTPHCPTAPAQFKARSALIHSIDPAAKTLMVVDSNSGQESIDQIPDWKGATDFVALNPYMCWQGEQCHYEWIDTLARTADAAGLPYWGVVQAYGDPPGDGQEMCTTTSGCGFARLPTAAEIHEEFAHWRATAMSNYLVFSWRWPDSMPSLWLENHPELQDQLAVEAGA